MGDKIKPPLLAGRPYSGVGDDSLPDNVKALPAHGKEIWVAAFNGAWSSYDSASTDLTQEGYAMAVAWAAVKKQYKKDAEGNWTKRSVIEGADGYFTKVWRSADGKMRWRATISDDGVDQYATRMTSDFLDDMCRRAMAPGGMPWLGISHYDVFSAIGAPDRVYRDGRQLKAEGVFLADSEDAFQRELALAAFETARSEASLLPAHRSIRTSIAFVPEAFVIEDCGVMAYTHGSLRHIALTTRPANSRADFTAEEDSMPRSKTLRDLRREDAAAIVGEELAGRLYEKEGDDTTQRTTEHDGLMYRAALEDEDGDVMVSADGENWEPVSATTRAGQPFAAAPLNDRATAWEAAKARGRIWAWATDADGKFSGAKARKGFAVFDSENPDLKIGMALPHHDIEGEKFVTSQRGVIAGGAVVQGARGGFKEFQEGDTEAAKIHLAGHYKQMDMTAPWEAERANLRHRAEELWLIEAVPELWEDSALETARQALMTDLTSGAVPRPTLDEARAVFDGGHQFGLSLLRATGATPLTIMNALRCIVSDPDDTWGEGAHQAEPADVRAVSPDVPFRTALAERYGIEPAPDAGLIATMNAEEVMDTAFHASWTLMDIIAANVQADPEEVSFEERLANVQAALNEFAQIINQVLAQSTQRSLTDGDGVKPGGADEGTVNPPPGEPDAATLAVDETLDAIRAFVRGAAPEGEQAQVLLETLGERLMPIIRRAAAPPDAAAELAATVLDRLEGMQRTIDTLVADKAGGGPPEPSSLAPRRTAARLPPPRRSVRALGIPAQEPQRRPGDPVSPHDYARGAHLRTGFNPYE